MEQPFCNSLRAGDTWEWTLGPDRALAAARPDYPAEAYSLKYVFRGASQLDVQSSIDDDGMFAFSVGQAQTAQLAAGTYAWVLVAVRASDGAEFTLAGGQVEVLADLRAIAGSYNGASWVKQTLDAIRAQLQGSASRAQKSHQIAGRAVEFYDPLQLLKLEEEFALRYRKELSDAGQINPANTDILCSFGGIR
jgi:hypothetical protein